MGLLRSNLVVSVTLFLLGGFYSSACGQKAEEPPVSASPPVATAEPSSTSPPQTPPIVEEPPPTILLPTIPKEPSSREDEKVSITNFAVYTLSRGKGVPPEAREALKKVEALVEADQKRGVSVTVEKTRIGIEGETRLCVDYKESREGTRAYERASAIVQGVDLVNLKVESCAAPAPETVTQKQEDPS